MFLIGLEACDVCRLGCGGEGVVDACFQAELECFGFAFAERDLDTTLDDGNPKCDGAPSICSTFLDAQADLAGSAFGACQGNAIVLFRFDARCLGGHGQLVVDDVCIGKREVVPTALAQNNLELIPCLPLDALGLSYFFQSQLEIARCFVCWVGGFGGNAATDCCRKAECHEKKCANGGCAVCAACHGFVSC